ncbi:hypothetical protein SFC43_25740 [Bacteroides sp. CR5/BHMF/2]|nr:hypothetical protein [Bacteroides sp. CR5/BHMF/2]
MGDLDMEGDAAFVGDVNYHPGVIVDETGTYIQRRIYQLLQPSFLTENGIVEEFHKAVI